MVNSAAANMTRVRSLCVFVGPLLLAAMVVVAIEPDEESRAVTYMDTLNTELNRQANIVAEANWAYESNLTEHNAQLKSDAYAKNANFTRVSAHGFTVTDPIQSPVGNRCERNRYFSINAECYNCLIVIEPICGKLCTH